MNTLNTAQLIDIAGIISLIAMLAFAVMLVLRCIRKCKGIFEKHYAVTIPPALNGAYARKRVGKRTAHDCKNAVFPRNPDSRAGLSGT